MTEKQLENHRIDNTPALPDAARPHPRPPVPRLQGTQQTARKPPRRTMRRRGRRVCWPASARVV